MTVKTKKKRNWWLLVLEILALLLVVMCFAIWRVFGLPLGPSLGSNDVQAEDPTQTAMVDETVNPTEASAEEAEQGQAQGAGANQVCGETHVWNVLVVGSDASDLFYPQGADFTRIVRVDFPGKKVTSFAFSRDLWVDTGKLNYKDPELESTKLGLVYYETSTRSNKNDPQKVKLDAVNDVAKTLTDNFEVKIDHYIAVDLEKLPAMIDAIGGLPINIPADLKDNVFNMEFKAGQQTLTGEQAAIYARSYQGSDLERIERNNLILNALRERLLDPAVWINLPQLVLDFDEAVLTDFSPKRITSLVCLLNEVPQESILQDGVREEWTSPYQDGGLLWDRTEVLSRLSELEIIP